MVYKDWIVNPDITQRRYDRARYVSKRTKVVAKPLPAKAKKKFGYGKKAAYGAGLTGAALLAAYFAPEEAMAAGAAGARRGAVSVARRAGRVVARRAYRRTLARSPRVRQAVNEAKDIARSYARKYEPLGVIKSKPVKSTRYYRGRVLKKYGY